MAVQETKYQVVIDWITEEIAAGRLQSGDRLMSEEKMCKKFGLCRQTVRRATSELVKQKMLTRLQGSGTYVGEAGPRVDTHRKRNMNVAVVSTFYESYIFPPTLRGIEKTLSESGYTMQVSFTDNKVANEHNILRNLLQKDNIDGLIVEPSTGALPNSNLKYYKRIMEKHIPIICFNDEYPDLDVPCVRMDDYGVALKAVRMLVEAGHRRIAGIFKLDDGQGLRRYNGYADGLVESGIQVNPKHVFWFDTVSQMELKELEEYIFRRIGDCTSVVCYNDEVSAQIIDLALKRGVRVPEDLSVVSFDDSNLAEISKVPFTSFPHPKEMLGRKVAENIVQMIKNPFFDGGYLFKSEAVWRDSIRKL